MIHKILVEPQKKIVESWTRKKKNGGEKSHLNLINATLENGKLPPARWK